MRAAKEWGLTPSQWQEESDWSKARMIAMCSIEEEMKALEYESIKKANKEPVGRKTKKR